MLAAAQENGLPGEHPLVKFDGRVHGRCDEAQTLFTSQTVTMLNKEATAMDIIKVSAKSRSTAVAGAIAGVVRESGRAEVQAIGAGAVNQATKAVAIAR
jgi:hypothetical protein